VTPVRIGVDKAFNAEAASGDKTISYLILARL
jgi:hypothetical protein